LPPWSRVEHAIAPLESRRGELGPHSPRRLDAGSDRRQPARRPRWYIRRPFPHSTPRDLPHRARIGPFARRTSSCRTGTTPSRSSHAGRNTGQRKTSFARGPALAPRRSTSLRCCRTHRAKCTWGTPACTPSPTCSPAMPASGVSTSCIRSVGTPSACRGERRHQGRVHPAERTPRNIASFKQDVISLGISIDWSTELSTSDPQYYRWNQWFFLRMLERGLVYRRRAKVNSAPAATPSLPTSRWKRAAAGVAGAWSSSGRSRSGRSGSPPTPTSCWKG